MRRHAAYRDAVPSAESLTSAELRTHLESVRAARVEVQHVLDEGRIVNDGRFSRAVIEASEGLRVAGVNETLGEQVSDFARRLQRAEADLSTALADAERREAAERSLAPSPAPPQRGPRAPLYAGAAVVVGVLGYVAARLLGAW